MAANHMPSPWTSERDAVLLRRWPTTDQTRDIIDELNSLPGIKITKGQQLSDRAGILNVRRPNADRAIWSDERREAFKRMWQAGDSHGDIIAALNAMEGRSFIKSAQLADEAKRLHIRRPAHFKQVKAVHAIERKPPRMPLPRRASEPIRAPKLSKSPIKVSLHVVYNQGFQLWQDGFLPVNKRDDLEAINKAIRRAEPGHPGFQLVTRWFGA